MSSVQKLLITSIHKNTSHKWRSSYPKFIDIANCNPKIQRLLAVEYVILIRYYYELAKGRAVYQCTDGPTGQQADNPPNSDRLGESHPTVLHYTVWVY
jgi:hypothetical protein